MLTLHRACELWLEFEQTRNDAFTSVEHIGKFIWKLRKECEMALKRFSSSVHLTVFPMGRQDMSSCSMLPCISHSENVSCTSEIGHRIPLWIRLKKPSGCMGPYHWLLDGRMMAGHPARKKSVYWFGRPPWELQTPDDSHWLDSICRICPAHANSLDGGWYVISRLHDIWSKEKRNTIVDEITPGGIHIICMYIWVFP